MDQMEMDDRILMTKLATTLERVVPMLDKIEKRQEEHEKRIAALETGAKIQEDRDKRPPITAPPAPAIPDIVWKIIWTLAAALAGVVGSKVTQ